MGRLLAIVQADRNACHDVLVSNLKAIGGIAETHDQIQNSTVQFFEEAKEQAEKIMEEIQ